MDSSECGTDSVSQPPRITKRNLIKRADICEKEICLKERTDLSDDESPQQSLRKSWHCCDPPISPGGENPSRKDSTVTGASTSSLENDSIVIRKARRLPDKIESNCKTDKPSSVDDSSVHLREKSNSKQGCALNNLFYGVIEECMAYTENWKIFYTNLPMDVLTEEETIRKNLRDAWDEAMKLKNSTPQTETLKSDQTLDKNEFQNPVDQGNPHCHDGEYLNSLRSKLSALASTFKTEETELRPAVSSTPIDNKIYRDILEYREKRKSNSISLRPDITETDVPSNSKDLLETVEINSPKINETPLLPNIHFNLTPMTNYAHKFPGFHKEYYTATDMLAYFAEICPDDDDEEEEEEENEKENNFIKSNPFFTNF